MTTNQVFPPGPGATEFDIQKWREEISGGFTGVVTGDVPAGTREIDPETGKPKDIWETPPAPVIFEVDANVSTVLVSWDIPDLTYVQYSEIFRGTVDNIDHADTQLIATIENNNTGLVQRRMWSDNPPNPAVGAIYYYWLRFLNSAGTPGPLYQQAGLPAELPADPSYMLEQLADSLGFDQFDVANGEMPVRFGATNPTLPDASWPIGSMFFNTTNSRFFRTDDGNLWVDTLNTTSLLGEIETEQLADLAVEAGKIGDQAVLNEKLGDLAVNLEKLAVQDGANLFSGSNFEDTKTTPWTQDPLYASAVTGWGRSSTYAHNGTYSWKCYPTGPAIRVSPRLATIPVIPGDQYIVTLWAYIDAAWNGSTENKLRFGVNTHGGTYISSISWYSITPNTWTEVKGQFTIPAGCNIMGVRLGGDHTAGHCWIDDMSLRKMAKSQDIEANAIIANNIAADAVEANKIVAGAVVADKIAANAITTTKMLIAGSNVIPNAKFKTEDFTNWSPWGGPVQQSIIPAVGASADFCCQFATGVTPNISTFAFEKAYNEVGAKDDGFTCVEGEVFNFRISAAHDGSYVSTNFRLIAYYWNSATQTFNNADSVMTVLSSAMTSGWADYSGNWTAPAGASVCWPYVYSTGQTAGNVYWTNLRVVRAADAQLIVDGAIVAGKLTANSVIAGNIAVGAITADTIGAEEIIANSANIKDAVIINAKIDRASVNKLKVISADIVDANITNAKIDRASVNKLKVVSADITDANITNAKIDRASVNKLKVVSADIVAANIQNAHIDRASVNKLKVVTADIVQANITTLLIGPNQVTVPDYGENTYKASGTFPISINANTAVGALVATSAWYDVTNATASLDAGVGNDVLCFSSFNSNSNGNPALLVRMQDYTSSGTEMHATIQIEYQVLWNGVSQGYFSAGVSSFVMANLTTQNDYIFNIDTSLSMNQLIAVAGTNTYKVQSRYKLYNDRFVAATQYSYLFWFIYGGAVSLLGVKR